MSDQQYNRAAVRVCAISDVECSRDCGTGFCKREREARYPVEQHEAAPADDELDAAARQYEGVPLSIARGLARAAIDAAQPEPPSADERATFEAWARNEFADGDDDPCKRGQCGYLDSTVDMAWMGWQARASSPNAAGAEGADERAVMGRLYEVACDALGRVTQALGLDLADTRTELILGAIEELNAQIAPAQAAEPVAIYQIRTEEGAWLDVPQQVYERAKSDPALTRAVYATPPAPASAPVGMMAALRQAREELSQVEWENDPPARVTALFSKIDALLYGAKHE
ncbi:TPA: hypothetical protein ACYLIB_005651 [Burkholderia cenocepacia]